MIRPTTCVLLGASTVAALLLSGCQDSGLRVLPNRPPVAIASVDSGNDGAAEQRLGYVINGEEAALDGSLSDDPDDPAQPQLLEFVWSFDAKPEDSALEDASIVVPEDDPETEDVNESAFPTFEPDALGTYRISLVVFDADGAESSPSIVVIQSVPPSDLTVELQWDATQADLDLHLIGPGGGYFSPSTDCFSWNPNPNWGAEELATDNPELDGDADGEGSGPYREVITLEEPPEGDYQVWVHYYSDHSEELGHSAVPAEATVEVRVFDILLDGATLDSDPMLSGTVWKVGVLSWPARTFSPLNAMSTHETEGGPDYNDEISD